MPLRTPRVAERTNVLIIGGAGFLGSHLCEYLLEKHNVICVDTYISGKEQNIDHLLSNPHFEFIRHDIREPLDFKTFKGLERFRVAHVGVQNLYYLACNISPAYSLKNPIDTALVCTQGTKNVLDIAHHFRSRLLFLSDASVYGLQKQGGMIKEEDGVFVPWRDHLWWHAQHLRSAESLIEAYRHTYSLDVKIARLFMTYGPNMYFDDGRCIPEFIRAALENEEIVIDQDFMSASCLYVSDAVDGLEKIMNTEKGTVYNLGHPTTYTLDEIVGRIIALTNSRSTTRRMKTTGNQQTLQAAWMQTSQNPSMGLLRDEAGWFPVVLLDEGLQKTVDFMKSLRGIRRIGS